MFDQQSIAGLRHEQEQDEAQAVAWFHKTSHEDKVRLWETIQSMCGNPMAEIISRCAQIGFTHVLLLAAKSEEVDFG